MTTKNDLATIAHCAEFSGLNPKEMLVGAVLASEHERLLEAYRFGRFGVGENICAAIVADIRLALKRGAPEHAADLLVALRLYLAQPKDRSTVTRLFRTAETAPAYSFHA